MREAREKAFSYFGKIDGLVNAAGGIMPDGVLQHNEDIFKMNLEGMKKVTDLNLWGTIIPTHVFGNAIAKAGGAVGILGRKKECCRAESRCNK